MPDEAPWVAGVRSQHECFNTGRRSSPDHGVAYERYLALHWCRSSAVEGSGAESSEFASIDRFVNYFVRDWDAF